jgi:hypothetical protein
MPELVSTGYPNAAKAMTATTMAAPAMIPFGGRVREGPGPVSAAPELSGVTGGWSGAPHCVQNFLSGGTSFPHWGQNGSLITWFHQVFAVPVHKERVFCQDTVAGFTGAIS